MNPHEIIKALEKCLNGYYGCNTGSCYFFANAISEHCWICAIRHALDLINRQKAEIEELKEELFFAKQKRANIFELVESYDKGRVAGCKDFAEEVEKRCVAGGIYPAFVRATIKRVKEEMTEGKE